jgi:hypothetical protein
VTYPLPHTGLVATLIAMRSGCVCRKCTELRAAMAARKAMSS